MFFIISIILLVIFSCIIELVYSGRLFTTRNFITIFHLSMVMVAYSGIYLVNPNINEGVLFLFFTFYLSFILTYYLCLPQKSIKKVLLVDLREDFYAISTYFAFIVLIFFLVKSITSYDLIFRQDIAGYRSKAMGFGTDSILFPSALSLIFYSFFCKGYVLFYSLLGAVSLAVRNHRALVYCIISVLLVFFESFISMGRISIYSWLFIYTIAIVMYRKDLYGRFLIGALIILILMIALSTLRYRYGFNLQEFLISNSIGYHSYSINLFSIYLDNEVQVSSVSYNGSAYFANISYMFGKLLSAIGLGLRTYLESTEFMNLGDFVYLGRNVFNKEIYANAFYSHLHSAYLDFGYFGGFIYGVVYGLLFAQSNRYLLEKRSASAFFIFIFINLLLYMSIMNNQMYHVKNVFVVIIFVVVYYLSKVRLRSNG